jgi:hypothetical protein
MAGTFGVTVAVMMLFFWLSVLSLLLSAPVRLLGKHDLSRRMVELGFAVWCGLLLIFVFFAFVEASSFHVYLAQIDTFVLLGPITLWRMGRVGQTFPVAYALAVHALLAIAALSGSMALLLSERQRA